MKNKSDKNTPKGIKTPNGSRKFAGLVIPKEELVERAELSKITSANLYKLLQHKNVPNRSKLSKKGQRINALVGMVTYGDIEEKGFSINIRRSPQLEVSNPKHDRKRKEKEKEKEKAIGKGVRFACDVGGIDVHKSTLVVAIANTKGIKVRKTVPNDEAGITDLIRFFTHYRVTHCAL
ncbi:MAG: hypothetical protein BAJALOKI1v1_40022 [Promethearchaeota archaeon]|nr:MAG: hypothetical protein BAJALOKI1v1_40022 [Candidatus Lokiarchaeota archaeon]